MQHRPDHPTLLEALAQFLLAEVSPSLEANKALQFRVLIAANLASMVANEHRTEPRRLEAELGRLRALLPEATALTLDELNRALVRRLQETNSPRELEAILHHLQATARETLEVTNPRFDLTHGHQP